MPQLLRIRGVATEAAARKIGERFGDGSVDGKMQAHVIIAS